MIEKPGDFRAGAPRRPGMLQRLADGVRGDSIRRFAGRSYHRTRQGIQFDDEDIQAGGGILRGVITADISARTGTYPNFTWGVGSADILNDNGSGVAYSTAVYSTFRDIIPASTEPVILGMGPDGLIFYVNGDC